MIRALVEVAATAGAAAAGWGAGIVLAGDAAPPPVRWGTAAGLGVALSAIQLALLVARKTGAAGSATAASHARRFLEECAAGAVDPRERAGRVAIGMASLLDDWFRIEDVRVLTEDDPAMSRLDPRVRTWLVANGAPIAAAQLDELRLGGLRLPVVQFVRDLSADLVMPLVHRDRLLGIVTGRGRAGRLLHSRRAADLRAVQHAAAGTLGELRLRAEADVQAAVAREVDAAATVQRETAPATASLYMAGCRVVRHYAPARQFSGSWWCARELPDGRLFAGIGEVTGRGVAAALLSASAMGVCESAVRSLGGGLELHGVLELLHGSVRSAGGGAFGMSAVVSLIDIDARIVTFAGAGHPFPFLIRPAARGLEGARGSLRSLVSRGTQLGAEQRPVRSLASEEILPGDVLVFFTASLTDARDEGGQTFGERRLQHILRRASLVGPIGPDGSDLVDQVAGEVAAHVAGRALDDDILVATVQFPVIAVDPHPLLELVAFTCELPAALADIATPPEVLAALDAAAAAPLASSDEVRLKIRALLRSAGFKPTGRSKPASEYLLAASPMRSINAAVDAGNAVSLHSGLPISVVDLDRVRAPLRVAPAPAGSSYLFNPAGQVIEVANLLCLIDADGPCGSPVKDAQRSKTDGATRRTLSLLWSSRELPGRGEAACRWYLDLVAATGARTAMVFPPPAA